MGFTFFASMCSKFYEFTCVCVVFSWGVWEGADGITCLFACVVDFVIPLRVFPSR